MGNIDLNDINIEDFTIVEKKLYFRGEEVLEEGSYPFGKLEFMKQIGEGANGRAYKVFHKILQMEQVIKISKSDYQKALLEAIKNSSTELSDVIAVVSDAGILCHPENTSYSVMSIVNNSISLKEWIDCRDNLLKFCEDYLGESPFESFSYYSGLIIQASLNLIICILNSYSKFVQNNTIHGDLNPNNILVRDSFFSTELQQSLVEYFNYTKEERNSLELLDPSINSIIDNLNSIRSRISPGTVSSSIYDVKFIDLGTSQLETTTRELGEQRDVHFILDSTRKLLKPYFTGTSLLRFINLENVNGELLFSFDDPDFDEMLSNAFEEKYGISNAVHNGRLTEDAIKQLEGMIEISNKIGLPPIGKCGFIFYTGNKLFEYLVNELLSPYPIFVDNETYDSSRYDGILDDGILDDGILDDDFLNEFMFLQKYIYQGNAPSSMVAGDILRLVALLVILLGYIHQDNRATKSEINELNSLISPSPLNESVKVDIRILDNSIFDAKFIETWEKLMVSQNKYLSLGVLIRWEELWNHLESVFRSEDGASAEIFSSIKLQGEEFLFNHQKV
ncbi:hypothetical protein KZW96_07725 [Streptococcus halitosis]|uniref:hypothetical protein n=1 Tax=Streptococcus halitosis TaxID=2172545 RepID=UPI0020058DB4|nr:hypothetical protein [Streptococcus halitosis]MCK6129420.1 hypothetical protein [Streptococcus halitosis]MCK6216423.1 hypothetical protein [Streptococcus halitosis]